MIEIGSYFEKSYSKDSDYSSELNWLPQGQSDFTLTFSGRSAIELALVDILKSNNIKRVYMPSYCCYSMLSPFIKHDIDLLFYNVHLTSEGLSYDIDFNAEFDLFFAMSYFGVEHTQDDIIKLMKERNIMVIEDITHRLLSKENHSHSSDYLAASLRKWFPIPTGGLVMKKEKFLNEKPIKNSDEFVIDQIKAMELKSRYLNNDKSVKKEDFFAKYSSLNQLMSNIDHTYKIDETSLNELYKLPIDKIIKQRTDNAKLLYDKLYTLNYIKPLVYDIDIEVMTPLFVPVVLPSIEARDKLLKKLISKNIYCPVHWPISKIIASNNQNTEVYNKGLSLICDQRYGNAEIQKIIETLGEFEQDNV